MKLVPGISGHNPIVRGYADRDGGRVLIRWDRTVTMVIRSLAYVSLPCSRVEAAAILRTFRAEFRRISYY